MLIGKESFALIVKSRAGDGGGYAKRASPKNGKNARERRREKRKLKHVPKDNHVSSKIGSATEKHSILGTATVVTRPVRHAASVITGTVTKQPPGDSKIGSEKVKGEKQVFQETKTKSKESNKVHLHSVKNEETKLGTKNLKTSNDP